MGKLVSICIPTYNNIISVERLINSIVCQTYKDIEVIISDDSTDDEAIQAIKNSLKKLDGVKTIYHHNDKGLGPTKNTNNAIKLASGEYIKVMHHDDCFHDELSLESFVRLLDNNEASMIAFSGSQETVYEADGRTVNRDKTYIRGLEDWQNGLLTADYRTLFLQNFIGAPSATIMRNKGFLFDEQLKWMVDVELYMRVLEDNKTYAATKEPLINIGLSDTQVTRDCIDNSREIIYPENLYVFDKYNLANNNRCKKYMTRMALSAGISYKDIKGHGISRIYYNKQWLIMKLKGKI